MSYSSSRRKALDARKSLAERSSAARSCALLVAQKYRVQRSVVLDLVRRISGVDLEAPATDADLAAALDLLERLRVRGLSG